MTIDPAALEAAKRLIERDTLYDDLPADIERVARALLDAKEELDLAWDTVEMQKRRAEKAEAELTALKARGLSRHTRAKLKRGQP